MSAYHGRGGAVLIGANAVGEVTAWSYEESGEETEAPAMGLTAKRYLTGLLEAGGQFTVNYDDGDTEQEALDVGDDVELHLHIRGTGSGLPEWSSVGNDAAGLVRITGISAQADTGSVIQRTYTYRNNLIRTDQPV